VNLELASGKFYGKTLRHQQVGGFRLSETRYAPGSALPYHSHESHYVGFVLSGTYTENYEQKVRASRPLTIVYHPAGELHAQYFDNTPVHLFRIELNQIRLRALSRMNLKVDWPGSRNGLAIGLAHKLYKEFCEPDAVSYLAIEGLVLELIAAMARQSQSLRNISRDPPGWLSQAGKLIESCFLESLTLGDIAHTVGVHPVTLAREFRRYYNCTVGDMVRRERISFACRQLLKPEESLTNIAIAAGFYDQSHFTKTFKRLMGMTPKARTASRIPLRSIRLLSPISFFCGSMACCH
jgi:AraC family transcriptional regulator